MSAYKNLSIEMQTVANAVSTLLELAAGEPVPFVLICQADKVVQYVGNVSREDGTELIESLLRRWKANRADIPAHYNPDLYEPPKEQP